MTLISRREFFEKTAASAAVAAAFTSVFGAALKAAPFDWPIGSQTYPHRPLLTDFPAFCKMMSDIGVTRLELCSPIGYKEAAFQVWANAKEAVKIMADHGIKSESGHFSLPELKQDQQKSIDWAKEIGMTQMVVAGLSDPAYGGNAPTTVDQVKKAADDYNKIGEVAHKNGLQQALHNEQFELSMVDGVRTYDRLFDLFDPTFVKMQFQMSTITAGLVGAEYFDKHPGRFISMHVQDVDMNTLVEPQPRAGGAPPAAGGGAAAGAGQRPAAAGGRGRGPQHPQVAVGKGTIDWVKTFQAAKKAGVQNYFVEQSWPLTQESVAYLKTLKV